MFRNCLTYNPIKFSGIIYPKVLNRVSHESKKDFLGRKKRQGRGTVLMFRNGKLIISGCLSEQEAKNRVYNLMQTIATECKLLSIKLLNIVVAGDAHVDLPLDYLFEKLDHWKSLEYELFPALIVRRNNISYTLFRSGRYFATGLKTEQDVSTARKFFESLISLVKDYKVQTVGSKFIRSLPRDRIFGRV